MAAQLEVTNVLSQKRCVRDALRIRLSHGFRMPKQIESQSKCFHKPTWPQFKAEVLPNMVSVGAPHLFSNHL